MCLRSRTRRSRARKLRFSGAPRRSNNIAFASVAQEVGTISPLFPFPLFFILSVLCEKVVFGPGTGALSALTHEVERRTRH